MDLVVSGLALLLMAMKAAKYFLIYVPLVATVLSYIDNDFVFEQQLKKKPWPEVVVIPCSYVW